MKSGLPSAWSGGPRSSRHSVTFAIMVSVAWNSTRSRYSSLAPAARARFRNSGQSPVQRSTGRVAQLSLPSTGSNPAERAAVLISSAVLVTIWGISGSFHLWLTTVEMDHTTERYLVEAGGAAGHGLRRTTLEQLCDPARPSLGTLGTFDRLDVLLAMCVGQLVECLFEPSLSQGGSHISGQRHLAWLSIGLHAHAHFITNALAAISFVVEGDANLRPR